MPIQDGLPDIYIFITNDIPNVLNISLEGEKIDAVRARKKRNLPVVMTKDEVKKVIMAMSGVNQLMAKLIYGSGKSRFWKLFSQTWRLLLKVTFATLGIILTTKNNNRSRFKVHGSKVGGFAVSAF